MKLKKPAPRPQVYRKSSHSIVNARIDHDALKIIARLKRAGHAAYIVGGGVRDLLLNKRPKDFDIATSATPRQVKALFRNCRIIGRRFKLAHIFFRGNKIIEVSTFRDSAIFEETEEELSDDKVTLAADNVYGTEHSDAIRRDLTINALFYDPLNYSIIDYVGGIEDLRQGIIRVIGDPNQRFIEDPVRMLRALRHAARTGFRLAEDCANSIHKHHALIEKCPAMRIFEELKKDLVSGYARPILQLMQEYSLLEHVLPQFGNKHASTIWQDRSYFLNALSHIDSNRENGAELSLTAILAVICVFTWNPEGSKDNILPEDQSISDLGLMINQAFSKFAVPRKEKERLSLVIKDAQEKFSQSSTARGRRRTSLAFERDSLLNYLGLTDELPAPELTRQRHTLPRRNKGYHNRMRR